MDTGAATARSGERFGRMAEVIDAVTQRLADGERIVWSEVERAHNELMPELGEQLATLQAILDAGVAAQDDGAGNGTVAGAGGGSLMDRLSQEMPGYRFLEVVHAGGQGTVFKALQQSTRRLVAIKVMHDGAVASEQRRQRFEREIKLTSHLQLPNIVQVYDSGVVQGQYYFVMQFVEGMPIDDYALLHCLSARERVRLVADTMRAISRAHQRGVIHRDLKPSNLLIDGDGAPQILDFGLAKALASAGDADDEHCISMIGHVVGTLPYLSPEQASGFDEVDVRGDIYAMGVVIFELLTGEYPYDLGETREQARNRILHQPPRRLRDVAIEDGWTGLPQRHELDDDLEAIVAKALAKDQNERYQSADNLVADLEAYLRGDVVLARADQGSYLLRKALRRYRYPLLMAGVLSVALVAATLISTRFWLEARAERDNARRVAILAQNTLDDVVGEIDNTIAPLAGGMEARKRLMESVSKNLDALEPLVAADVTMEGVLHSLREKQGDIAAATGRSAEAEVLYESLLDAVEQGDPAGTAALTDPNLPARLYRKLAQVSATPRAYAEQAVATARLAVEADPSAEGVRELCAALVQLGQLVTEEGRYEVAAAQIDEALTLLDEERFAAEGVEAVAVWDELLADALSCDARIRSRVGDGTGSRAALEEAIAIRARMIEQRPQDVQVRYKVMLSLTALAGLLRNEGAYADAMEPAAAAIAAGEYLLAVEPANLRWTRDLIDPNIILANLLRLRKDPQAALAPASATVKLAEHLVQMEPQSDEWKRSLGYALTSRGSALQDSGDPEAALCDLQEAADIRAELCAANPGHIAYLEQWGEAHNRLASCLAKLKRHEESWVHWQESLRIHSELRERQPDVGDRHLDVIYCHINMSAWHIRQRTAEHDAEAQALLDRAEAALTDLCGSPLFDGLNGQCAECAQAVADNRGIVAKRRAAQPAG